MKVLDLFAGSGGFTTAATQAGHTVVACVNHWPRAVETHAANHPGTMHVCQDAGLVDPRDMPAHDAMTASPSCQGHTPARGVDRPRHDASRATAWCVVNFAEICRPRWIYVENVVPFMSWTLYRHWRAALTDLGYRIGESVLNAREFGVAQDRERVFVVCELRGKTPVRIESPKLAPVPASRVIDFASGAWSPIVGHAAKTVARAKRGRADFGERYLMPYYKSGSGLTGRSLERPIGTITTKPRWALVDGDRMRLLTLDETRVFMGFAPGYRLLGTIADQNQLLGNAVVPAVARAAIEQTVGVGRKAVA
jgi:DNA (cytosine-5)-methyltransferase 1